MTLLNRSSRTLAEVLAYFPEVYSTELLAFYRGEAAGLNFYRHDPNRIQKIERRMAHPARQCLTPALDPYRTPGELVSIDEILDLQPRNGGLNLS